MEKVIAYFSMEIALESDMATYSGGLSVLAGDTLRSAADMKVPMVGVTLLHRKGYFHQKLEPDGTQRELPVEWKIEDFLKEMPQRVSLKLSGRAVQIRAWRYEITGISGFKVPVYFLDTDLPENAEPDRPLTHFLYGGDDRYRLSQEVVLGIGGVRMLRALGYENIGKFHMNEGHASLLTFALLDERPKEPDGTWVTATDIEVLRDRCVFTTHTPVPAGHDQFPVEMVGQVLGRPEVTAMPELFVQQGKVNMTTLALNLSGYINGVSLKHAEVSRKMFPGYKIDDITNGVHAASWTTGPFQALFDRYMPGWREDNFILRYALKIPKEEVWAAHMEVKRELLDYVGQKTGSALDPNIFTLGFARRAVTYKRPDLLFFDLERLQQIVLKAGAMQIIFAGKAHPHDKGGKELIRRIFQASEKLKGKIQVVYLENYDMRLGKMVTAGVDVWLNNPQPPLEASGTSGMKSALNGVPSLSVLDGWWIEGHMEGVTGWAFGDPSDTQGVDRVQQDAGSLYDKLENTVMPLFYGNQDRFRSVMIHSIALNGSYFNTQRMLQQYIVNAYFR
ncbi:MAG: alpha-glucan family phosphorylase [Candidatus Omnitrophica bacterium]|nr:alpha-glucan family phosphorylase [Candidatus Omnitrophota bacterium]